ncbi:MAG: CopL family metal-binding regulatory protein [Steroidobacteraceae bacterium]
MRRRLAKILHPKAALFVLLVFQLVVGLPLQTARAALDGHDVPTPATTVASAQADCPMHDSPHGMMPSQGVNKHATAGHHDCCHVTACQCHCVYTPAAFDLPPPADVATTVAIQSLSSAQFVAPRIDEFLRPPIA